MTAFVLDASVTAAWLLPDAASEHTRRLYTLIRRDEVEPQAPNLWQWECSNLISSGVHSGRIPPASVEGLWGVLEAIRHRVELHELAPAQHKAVLDVCKHLEKQGFEVTYLRPDRTGRTTSLPWRVMRTSSPCSTSSIRAENLLLAS